MAWLLSLGVDLFLHAGLLARLYAEADPFLLPADAAFRRIPLGYLAFLLLTTSLYWLLMRLDVRGFARGWWHGLSSGLVVWGSLALGLYSISTASAGLLVAWWLGQSVELGLAGGTMAAVAGGLPARRAWTRVVGAVLALFAATVTLQSLGLAPAAFRPTTPTPPQSTAGSTAPGA